MLPPGQQGNSDQNHNVLAGKMESPEILMIPSKAKPLHIDAASVGCGFVLFPKEAANVFQEDRIVHTALETNKTQLWRDVKRYNPDIPIHRMLASVNHALDFPSALAYALKALDKVGSYPGYSIAMDIMAVSGSEKTPVEVYVGFNWKSSRQKLVGAAPQKILPEKKWWQFWK
jgi:hypothetical protein